MYIFYNIQYLC